MRYLQGTFFAMAISCSRLSSYSFVMAPIAIENCAATAEKCDRAAPLAFPIDEVGTMTLHLAGV